MSEQRLHGLIFRTRGTFGLGGLQTTLPPGFLEVAAELAGEVFLDAGRAARLALTHGPQPVRCSSHRYSPAEQTSPQFLALGQHFAYRLGWGTRLRRT